MSAQDGELTVREGSEFKQVSVADVEIELAARLRAVAVDDRPVSRTCVLNLIIFVEDAADAQAVSRSVDRLADAHPIRVIGMILDAGVAENEVRAWVKAACANLMPGSRLCSEEIGLIAHPDSAARLASAVQSLLSPDLPVALWWRGGSPFLSRLFKSLANVADKIVVDSIRFGDGPAALDTLRRLDEHNGGRASLADMNWERTASWRATLAACFDDPEVLRLLPLVDRCEIAFSLGPKNASAPPSARSLLLAGWLINRLPSIAGRGDIKGQRSKTASPGAITGLKLFSSSSRAGVSVSWKGGSPGISATALDASGASVRSWHFTPDPEGEAELLHRCIDSVAKDRLLDAALRAD